MARGINLIGSAIGNCGRLNGCESAPYQISNQLANSEGILLDSEVLSYINDAHDIAAQRNFFIKVAKRAASALNQGNFPIFIGGDHSCAIGSWSGIAHNLYQHDQELGLIWVDAHLDAHQPQTSPTGNLHGMPVAHLLGHGYLPLTSILNNLPKLKPHNLVYFGIRSFEKAEQEFLEKLGVRIYYQHMLTAQNFEELFLNEFNRLAAQTNGKVGISLDMDGLDPNHIHAVGTPVANGINSNQFLKVMRDIEIKHLLAFEIAEYNPFLDDNHASISYTLQLIKLLISRIQHDN